MAAAEALHAVPDEDDDLANGRVGHRFREAIRDQIAGYQDPHRHRAEIGRKALAQLPPADVDKAVDIALAHLVSQVLASSLRQLFKASPFEMQTLAADGAVVDLPPPKQGRSRRAQSLKPYERLLARTVPLGDGAAPRLGDMTADQLDLVAALRFKQAADTEARGRQFAALAELVRSHRVGTVRDLPERVLVRLPAGLSDDSDEVGGQ